MNFKLYMLFCFTLLCAWSCQDQAEPINGELTSILNPADVDLTKGISPYFTTDEIADFDLDDLDYLDRVLASPSRVYTGVTKGLGSAIRVPAGSVDALQEAVDQAGDGGAVLLETGTHTESGTVTVTNNVTIAGEDGATVIFDVGTYEATGQVVPGIHLYKAPRATIQNIKFIAQSDPGGTAILIDHSPRTLIRNNTTEGFSIGVLVNNKGNCFIIGNHFTSSLAWLTGEIIDAYGICVMNASKARVIDNYSTSGVFGIWMCGDKGLAFKNTCEANFVGHIYCKVPDAVYPLPSGEVAGSVIAATKWMGRCNEANNNFDAGYLLIDGANRNHLNTNFASGNGTYDYDLTGDTERFGFFTPRSSRNHVKVLGKNTVKDCGELNYVHGGVHIDTTTDPCF